MWFNGLMRWIFISPHLDDAILSTGGLIYELTQAGREVEIWTIMCGFLENEDVSALAGKIHTQWGFRSTEETIRSRRLEDQRAAEILKAQPIHFDFRDCIYRRDMTGNWLYDMNTFVPPHPEDQQLVEGIANALAERLLPDDELVCPLAVGAHVDHVITRMAVECLKRPLWYYADIPYLLYNPSGLEETRRIMLAKEQKVSWKGLMAWQRAVAAYTSQIPMEFETAWKMRSMIMRYGIRGVRLWSLPRAIL
jgi:LmbE family N-acetylglucosaminyl deacetylase